MQDLVSHASCSLHLHDWAAVAYALCCIRLVSAHLSSAGCSVNPGVLVAALHLGLEEPSTALLRADFREGFTPSTSDDVFRDPSGSGQIRALAQAARANRQRLDAGAPPLQGRIVRQDPVTYATS